MWNHNCDMTDEARIPSKFGHETVTVKRQFLGRSNTYDCIQLQLDTSVFKAYRETMRRAATNDLYNISVPKPAFFGSQNYDHSDIQGCSTVNLSDAEGSFP